MYRIRKIIAIIITVCMAAALAACAQANNKENETAPVHVIADISLDEEKETDDAEMDNASSETVTIKADALGQPVSASLKRSGEDMEESIDVADIPFKVNVSYYLDDKQVTPEDLAGATGSLRIRFDYENNTDPVVKMYGEELRSMVPLVFISMITLPKERFSDVKVTNGSVTEMAGSQIAYGYALPGLKEALGIDAVKDKLNEVGEALEEDDADEQRAEEDDEMFPEYFEITADTKDCKIEYTATIVMNGLFRDTKTEDLDDIDELINDFSKFGEAGDELADGVGELGGGAWELFEGIESYADAVASLADGAGQLSDAATQLAGQNGALTEGSAQLASGLLQLQKTLESIPGMEELSKAAGQLASGADSLNSGIKGYTGAVSQISDGASQLASGAGELSSAGDDLKSGYWQMLEGISELKDGVNEMNEKMFQNISSLSEGALPQAVGRYRILQQADKGFTAWNTYDGTEGDIRFILETEEIG